jgi:hypothetical protein
VRLCRCLLVVPSIFAIVAQPVAMHRDDAAIPRSPVLQRFFALPDPAPEQVRALRHLEARNEHFDSTAWMDIWTELDRSGFRYQVIDEGGSEYIRDHVFRATLKSESEVRASGGMERASFTPDNYVFADGGVQADGTQSVLVKPRKKDVLFVEGSIFLSPDDGDLVRLEGRMSKAPSFWTRRVEIVRWFRRVAGFRMPVALESTANILIAGRSTFRMSYEYETVNGQRVGDPQPQRRLSQLR